jgi:DNA-binding MarR family transcriptional regulator
MNSDTKQYQILEVVETADEPLDASEIADRVDRKTNTVSAALSSLNDDGYLNRQGEGVSNNPYRYTLSGKGEAVVRSNGDEPDGPSGLECLFDSAGDDEDAAQEAEDTRDEEDDAADPLRVEALEERLRAVEDAVGSNNVAREDLNYRLGQVERRVNATGDGGGEASLCMPVADSDAPLDHATVIHQLGSRYKVRDYLRALFGLPEQDEKDEDISESEQRAATDDAVEVVEKQD